MSFILSVQQLPCSGANSLNNPIVLVRGLGRSAGFWMDFPHHLCPYAPVYLVDLRGMGKSPGRWGAGSVAALAQDLVDTLDANKLLPCHLVGISLGGMACVEAAGLLSNRPQNIASLTVIASSSRATGEKRIAARALLRILPELFRSAPRNQRLAKFLVSEEFLNNNPKIPAEWDALQRTENFRSVATFRQLWAAAWYNAAPALKKIAKPVLCVVSRNDGLVSWLNTPRLWEMNAQAEMVILDSVGHDIPTEKPAELAKILTNFFVRTETDS